MFFGGFPGFDEGMRRPSQRADTTKFYTDLGVSKDATSAEIKKVFSFVYFGLFHLGVQEAGDSTSSRQGR